MREFQRFIRLATAAGVLLVGIGCAQTTEPPSSPAVGVQATEPSRSSATGIQTAEPAPSNAMAPQPATAPSHSMAPQPATAPQPAEPMRNAVAVAQPTLLPSTAVVVPVAVEMKDTAASVRTAAILLAGQEPVTGLPPALAQSPRWAAFSKEVTANWARYSQRSADPMSQWALAELPVAPDTVFYPFSGPDFVTVHQLFPSAQRYVMIAMQNAERPLDLANLAPISSTLALLC